MQEQRRNEVPVPVRNRWVLDRTQSTCDVHKLPQPHWCSPKQLGQAMQLSTISSLFSFS